jgi:putative Mg2+ transporter-C (MgtC) family protein
MLLASSTSLGGWDALLRLLAAGGLGALVGLEREITDHKAGMRTHLLVSLGSCLFTLVSAYAFVPNGHAVSDPTRIAAQVVTGIGFLGAGAILRDGLTVRGLTTAASLWVVAAIGMACGAGWYWPAVAGTGITLVVLWPLRRLAAVTVDRIRPSERRLVVELRPGESVARLLDRFGELASVQINDEADRRVVELELDRELDRKDVSDLADLDYVLGVRWQR